MSVYVDKPSEDSGADLFLIFVDEGRGEDAEERFALYLEECDDCNYNCNEDGESETYDKAVKKKTVNC